MHFDKAGRENTAQTLKLAYERAKALELNEVAVASSKGETAYRALEIFHEFKVTVVTYHCGFREPFKNVMTEDVHADLQKKAFNLISGSHALSGIERSVAQKHSGVYPVLLIADTFRLLGQGTKVAVEIAESEEEDDPPETDC